MLLDCMHSLIACSLLVFAQVRTAIRHDDVIATLQSLNLIRFWKGQHVISVSACMA